jgi:hypothetical protein
MHRELRQIIREELWRSVAWIGLGMVGWPILTEELAWLETTVVTVFVFPVLTWAVLTAGFIGVRAVTASDLQVQTPTGLSLSLLCGVILGGVSAVYLVGVEGYSTLWVSVLYVALSLGTVLSYWYSGLYDSLPEVHS